LEAFSSVKKIFTRSALSKEISDYNSMISIPYMNFMHFNFFAYSTIGSIDIMGNVSLLSWLFENLFSFYFYILWKIDSFALLLSLLYFFSFLGISPLVYCSAA
jgi:hypothetical protein